MADTVKEFMDEMYSRSLRNYLDSRSCLAKVSGWFVGFFSQKPYSCYVDLSESLFERLKKEENIKATGSVIDIGGYTVRCSSETEVIITSSVFTSSYNPCICGLKDLADQ